MSLGQLAALLHRPHIVSGFAQPVPLAKPVKEAAKIVIKQQVKQVTNQRKRRKKRAEGEQTSLKAMRKQYTQLKKEARAKLTAAKKEELAKRLSEAKGSAAKKKIRADLKAKLAKLLKSIPGAGKAKYERVKALLVKVKGLTWV